VAVVTTELLKTYAHPMHWVPVKLSPSTLSFYSSHWPSASTKGRFSIYTMFQKKLS